MMILDVWLFVNIAGVPWIGQYLEEFDLKTHDLIVIKCHPPFVFRLSQRYVSESFVELPVLMAKLDGEEKDVLIIQKYLVDAEVPFQCGKQHLNPGASKLAE